MVLSGIAGYKRAAPTEMSGWLGGPPHFAQYLCSLEILAALDILVRRTFYGSDPRGFNSRAVPRLPAPGRAVSSLSDAGE